MCSSDLTDGPEAPRPLGRVVALDLGDAMGAQEAVEIGLSGLGAGDGDAEEFEFHRVVDFF